MLLVEIITNITAKGSYRNCNNKIILFDIRSKRNPTTTLHQMLWLRMKIEGQSVLVGVIGGHIYSKICYLLVQRLAPSLALALPIFFFLLIFFLCFSFPKP